MLFPNHLQQQVLFLQSVIRKKANDIKNSVIQFLRQSNIICSLQNQNPQLDKISTVSNNNNRNKSDKRLSGNNHSGSRKKTGKTNIVILTDSMIKHLNGYEIWKKVGKWKVFVKGFGGANS